MFDIEAKIYKSLPEDTKEAIESGDAIFKCRMGSICVIDSELEELFDVLPLHNGKFGFCIEIPYKKGIFRTHFGEIVCKKKGKIKFLNNCLLDLRFYNLEIIPWDVKVKKRL